MLRYKSISDGNHTVTLINNQLFVWYDFVAEIPQESMYEVYFKFDQFKTELKCDRRHGCYINKSIKIGDTELKLHGCTRKYFTNKVFNHLKNYIKEKTGMIDIKLKLPQQNTQQNKDYFINNLVDNFETYSNMLYDEIIAIISNTSQDLKIIERVDNKNDEMIVYIK